MPARREAVEGLPYGGIHVPPDGDTAQDNTHWKSLVS